MIEWIYDIGKAYSYLDDLYDQIQKDQITKENILNEIENVLQLINRQKLHNAYGEIHFGPGP